ncbi:MAG: hypothetical protein IT323_18850 [Anaerolineae bacterium]|nr:hypothetical protein [Anaerolineae bacterium]
MGMPARLLRMVLAAAVVITLALLTAHPSNRLDAGTFQGEPTVEPEQTVEPEPPQNEPPPQTGDDRRLNPFPDEYYSIWCNFDQIEVWRAVPESVLLGKIPLTLVLGLNGSTDAGNGLTVSRSGGTVTVSGANGNLAPTPGSKSFSLDECIARNGGAPDAPPAGPPVAPPPPAPLPTPFANSAPSAAVDPELCRNTLYFIQNAGQCAIVTGVGLWAPLLLGFCGGPAGATAAGMLGLVVISRRRVRRK